MYDSVFSDVTYVAAVLRSTPSVLRAQLLSLDDAALRWRATPEDWCIKEVIGHLIETDRDAFMGRIKTMIASEHPTLGGMDIHGLVAERHDSERAVSELIDELAFQRVEIADFVAGLTPEDLACAGHYPRMGDLTVADFVYEWPFHDASHIAQIQDVIKAQMLPHMGALMRKAVGG